jgi:zinc protease
VTATNIPAVPSQPPAGIHLIDRPGSVQTVLYLGTLGERTDPDYFPLLVMNKVVGGDSASRIFLNLRKVTVFDTEGRPVAGSGENNK